MLIQVKPGLSLLMPLILKEKGISEVSKTKLQGVVIDNKIKLQHPVMCILSSRIALETSILTITLSATLDTGYRWATF